MYSRPHRSEMDEVGIQTAISMYFGQNLREKNVIVADIGVSHEHE